MEIHVLRFLRSQGTSRSCNQPGHIQKALKMFKRKVKRHGLVIVAVETPEVWWDETEDGLITLEKNASKNLAKLKL